MFNLLGICPKNRINNNWLLVSTEKWWSLSVRIMTFPIEWNVIKFMFQTTKQINLTILYTDIWHPTDTTQNICVAPRKRRDKELIHVVDGGNTNNKPPIWEWFIPIRWRQPTSGVNKRLTPQVVGQNLLPRPWFFEKKKRSPKKTTGETTFH
jgi:hypothetical protein